MLASGVICFVGTSFRGEQCASHFESHLFWAVFCLPFFAALRIGKLVSPSRALTGWLTINDMVLANDVLRLRICHSKTDPFGRVT